MLSQNSATAKILERAGKLFRGSKGTRTAEAFGTLFLCSPLNLVVLSIFGSSRWIKKKSPYASVVRIPFFALKLSRPWKCKLNNLAVKFAVGRRGLEHLAQWRHCINNQ